MFPVHNQSGLPNIMGLKKAANGCTVIGKAWVLPMSYLHHRFSFWNYSKQPVRLLTKRVIRFKTLNWYPRIPPWLTLNIKILWKKIHPFDITTYHNHFRFEYWTTIFVCWSHTEWILAPALQQLLSTRTENVIL